MRSYRSVLFVPAHKPNWAAKALAAGADAIVIDLEDSVPAAEKAPAREQAAKSIRDLREASAQVGVFVRVNPHDTGLTGADLEVTVTPAAVAGQPATVSISPAMPYYTIDANVETLPAKSGGTVQITRPLRPVRMRSIAKGCTRLPPLAKAS